MDESQIEDLISDVVSRLRHVQGVAAIALGGSRARGTATRHSDVDIALYYAPETPLDLDDLQRIAQDLDDEHPTRPLTGIGGWGPWINGGGWLHVRGMPVDFLYRDLHQVSDCIEQCHAGAVSIVYQPSHPHGFVTSIYAAEVALCRVLWDPHGVAQSLKAQATPYPGALKRALIDRFFWEARFALQAARKGASHSDVAYVAGCCFRSVSCLTQTLFALNERYWMNEKGAVALAATFPQRPDRLVERVNGAFASLSDAADILGAAIETLAALIDETETLLTT